MVLDERNRRTVAKALVNLAEFEVTAVEDVGDREADGGPEHVLVFDIGSDEPGDIERLVDLGQVIIADVMLVLDIGAPGQLRVRDVVADLDIAPAILDSADRPLVARQRVANRRPFSTEGRVDLGARPADRIEEDRARALEADAIGARKVADALLSVVDRDEVDDVADSVIVKRQVGLAPAAEVVGEFGLDLPALRRDELAVARILSSGAELWLGEEVEEADLSDAAP